MGKTSTRMYRSELSPLWERVEIMCSSSRIHKLVGWIAVVFLVACTSAPQVHVDKDSHANFASYKTFSWFEQSNAPSAPADPAKAPSTLATQRMHSAITAALQSKGFTAVDANPDFRVSYVLNVYD